MLPSTTSLVFLALAVSCLVLSTLVLSQEIGEINRKRSDDERISHQWMYTGKRRLIKDEYKRLYPDGMLDRLQFLLEIVGFLMLFIAAIASGAFRHWTGR